MSKTILGISAFYHDSAACVVVDGTIIAAAQEERFTRKKHDEGFPKNAVAKTLEIANCNIENIDAVVFYDKPFQKFNRILETHLAFAPRGLISFVHSMPVWLKDKLWISDIIASELQYKGKILFTEHHEAHAASAFYPSHFENAAILTVDGVGEYATTSIAIGNGNKIEIIKEQHFPHSLGLLYSAFTYFIGFKVNSGEYKVMGLAPYGNPTYVQRIYDNLIEVKEDGSFILNMEYFNFATGLTMTNNKFASLFDGPARLPESLLTRREMNIAASIQAVTEQIMLKIVHHVKSITGEKNLCLAGGVALNCVVNGKIIKEEIFESLWIQPAAGDAGGALGAALLANYHYFQEPRVILAFDRQQGSLLGTQYHDAEIVKYLDSSGYPYIHYKTDEELCKATAGLIAEENIVGWFQGRMEFGPRALGNRSILGDARSSRMQKIMNLKIKYRESFRPFAPSVLFEYANEWFDISCESPYMLIVADVRKEKRTVDDGNKNSPEGLDSINNRRSEIPAVTHIDFTSRLHTVKKDINPLFHMLISHFYQLTQCPMIINTSFNVRGEPIVESPVHAYRCFMRTEMDVLVIGKYLLWKKDQPIFKEVHDWKTDYQLD
jgi:carbamoyltransferase